MALKSFVKISGVNNLSDARYCAGMGVDVLGFSFEPGDPNYMDPVKYTAITEWLAGTAFAAEFSRHHAEEIKEILQQYPPVDYLQISRPEYLTALQELQVPIILKIDARELDDLAQVGEKLRSSAHEVAFFLFESEEDEVPSAMTDQVMTLAEQYPILLGFGLTEENVPLLLEEGHLKGIALRGGQEIKPGFKDFDDLADILEAIEIDDLE
ncbi:MAG: phosphoribosylanthranilate isomerase [Cyclobacteriaceae bacterium]